MERGLDTCAACADLICDRLKERLVVLEEVERRVGTKIPLDDRERFIRPYESQVRLAKLRDGD